MKSTFSIINMVVGLFAMVIGIGNLQNPASNASSAVVALVALAVGATCLWLANESVGQEQ
jgi:fucose permease